MGGAAISWGRDRLGTGKIFRDHLTAPNRRVPVSATSDTNQKASACWGWRDCRSSTGHWTGTPRLSRLQLIVPQNLALQPAANKGIGKGENKSGPVCFVSLRGMGSDPSGRAA